MLLYTGGGGEVRCPWNIEIGDGTIIGHDAKLDGRNGLVIGSNVNLSSGVWIWTEEHNYNDEMFSCTGKGEKVIVEDRAWLSCRTVILPGVKIGQGAVLAAGAVATKDLEPYAVYGGIPAKRICERNRRIRYEFNGNYVPFI